MAPPTAGVIVGVEVEAVELGLAKALQSHGSFVLSES